MAPRFLNAREAAKIDELLMGSKYRFGLMQLMELAGLSVAAATRHFIINHLGTLKRDQISKSSSESESTKTTTTTTTTTQLPSSSGREDHKKVSVLALVGPGNNGGDALVAARHLKLYGYDCCVWIPKPSTKELYQDLTTQCQHMGVDVVQGAHFSSVSSSSSSSDTTTTTSSDDGSGSEKDSHALECIRGFDLIVDGLFGFSFSGGEIREPYASVIQLVNESKVPVISIDIPSGWNVDGEEGESSTDGSSSGSKSPSGIRSSALVSLTAPKLCAKSFKGVHYLGGRFVPPPLAEEFDLNLPEYEGDDVFVCL